jgi:hypothetical protein
LLSYGFRKWAAQQRKTPKIEYIPMIYINASRSVRGRQILARLLSRIQCHLIF